MKPPECNVEEKLATFNQLKIFLYVMAANYTPFFRQIVDFLQPRACPRTVSMKIGGPAYRGGRNKAGEWFLEVMARTKHIRAKNMPKKHQIILDYREEFPEDMACCSRGPQRLVIFGGMRFFHLEAVRLYESYRILASGEWPHLSVPTALYLARKYPKAGVDSVESANALIRRNSLEEFYEQGAYMVGC